MKRLILIIILVIGSTSTYASKKEEINKQIASSFSKDFTGAKDVSWQTEKQYEKATFILNGLVMSAYYTENGDLKGVSRNVLSDHLPVLLLVKLKKNYGDYWISDIMEVTFDNQTTWYVKLERADKSVVLKSGLYNDWVLYKKIKKE